VQWGVEVVEIRAAAGETEAVARWAARVSFVENIASAVGRRYDAALEGVGGIVGSRTARWAEVLSRAVAEARLHRRPWHAV